jgi:SAM-dependent methyltransferase
VTQPAPDWFADESFWEVIYPFIFADAARAAAVGDVAAIASLVARPFSTVLDLCCGPGRHSIAFAKRGARVTGVDRSPFLLDRARRYASSEGVDVRWIQADMREFREPGGFELALNLFTSFGYFEEPADNARVLANVAVNLVPGGTFVMDVMGKEVIARIFQPCGAQELEDGAVLVQRRKVIDGWSRIENDWLVIRNGGTRPFRFRHWLYSAAELRAMLKEAGFGRIDVFGSLDGSPYDADASRLIVRAQKTG